MTSPDDIRIDIPLDPQQVDETDFPWALLDQARDPALIRENALMTPAIPGTPPSETRGGQSRSCSVAQSLTWATCVNLFFARPPPIPPPT